jgi:type I restriction enzyme S subunit
LDTAWFIFHYLKSPVGQRNLLAGGRGIGRPNLNAPTIESIPIPLPPQDEQQRIVFEIERRLSAVEVVEASVEAHLKRAERLRQAILKHAFEGKLVAQDLTDEPAAALLERIRTERITTNGTARPPRQPLTHVKPPTRAVQEPLPL